MFKKLRPGRFCGPAKSKTEPGSEEASGRPTAPPRLKLPPRGTAGAPKPSHLKPVEKADVPRPAPRAVARPLAQPFERPARPGIPPYRESEARGAEVQSLGRLMLVGPQIRLKGEIEACERLVVEGTVEGEVSATERLEVARGGRFQGTARIESCAIDGHFDGDLDVSGLLSLKANGRVTGKVRYGEIEIERGGTLAGDVAAQGAGGNAAHGSAVAQDRTAGPRPA